MATVIFNSGANQFLSKLDNLNFVSRILENGKIEVTSSPETLQIIRGIFVQYQITIDLAIKAIDIMPNSDKVNIAQGATIFPTINQDFFQSIVDSLNFMPINMNSLTEGSVFDNYVILYDNEDDDTRFEIKITAINNCIDYAVKDLTNELDEFYFEDMVEQLNTFLEKELGYELNYTISITNSQN